jgi:hypothetical protein
MMDGITSLGQFFAWHCRPDPSGNGAQRSGSRVTSMFTCFLFKGWEWFQV